jgi:hypothetical protein
MRGAVASATFFLAVDEEDEEDDPAPTSCSVSGTFCADMHVAQRINFPAY